MNTRIKNAPKILMLVLTILISSLTISCSEDGVDGVDGIDGAPGAPGIPGTPGTPGADGNANVIASSWIPANWTLNLNNPDRFRSMLIPPPTGVNATAFRDNYMIMVYAKQYGTNSVYPLPSSGRWNNILYNYEINNLGSFAGIIINVTSTNGVAFTPLQVDASQGNAFRYVAIPPTSGRGLTPIDYTTMSYSEVCASLNIPE